MNKQTKEHIRKAGYVLKALNNPKRMLIIDLLQRKELPISVIQDILNMEKRQTQRHLDHLLKIQLIQKYRGDHDWRTICYSLNLEKYQHYISHLQKMIA